MTTAVPFLDDAGKQVLDGNGAAMMRPEGFDPHFFVQQGLKDRPGLDALMDITRIPNSGINMGEAYVVARYAYLYKHLKNFGQRQQWDAQRIGKQYHREFVAYASAALGLYAAALGLSQEEILEISNLYAWKNSTFKRDTEYDSDFSHLAKYNVENTKIGMDLYNSVKLSK